MTGLASGGLLSVPATTGDRSLSGVLTNHGTVQISGSVYISRSASILNQAGGVFTVNGATTLGPIPSSGLFGGSLVNYGSVSVSEVSVLWFCVFVSL